jgi:hypothetical protein
MASTGFASETPAGHETPEYDESGLSVVVLSDIVSGMWPFAAHASNTTWCGNRHPAIDSCFALGLDTGELARELAAPGAPNTRPTFFFPLPSSGNGFGRPQNTNRDRMFRA